MNLDVDETKWQRYFELHDRLDEMETTVLHLTAWDAAIFTREWK
jgi:hypothetical protein